MTTVGQIANAQFFLQTVRVLHVTRPSKLLERPWAQTQQQQQQQQQHKNTTKTNAS